jgi:hypothetical protein
MKSAACRTGVFAESERTSHVIISATVCTPCDRGYVLFDRRVIAEGPSADLTVNPVVRRHFLGESFPTSAVHPLIPTLNTG